MPLPPLPSPMMADFFVFTSALFDVVNLRVRFLYAFFVRSVIYVLVFVYTHIKKDSLKCLPPNVIVMPISLYFSSFV